MKKLYFNLCALDIMLKTKITVSDKYSSPEKLTIQ